MIYHVVIAFDRGAEGDLKPCEALENRNFTRSSLQALIRAADERLNEDLERLDHSDVEDGATRGGART